MDSKDAPQKKQFSDAIVIANTKSGKSVRFYTKRKSGGKIPQIRPSQKQNRSESQCSCTIQELMGQICIYGGNCRLPASRATPSTAPQPVSVWAVLGTLAVGIPNQKKKKGLQETPIPDSSPGGFLFVSPRNVTVFGHTRRPATPRYRTPTPLATILLGREHDNVCLTFTVHKYV